MTKIKKLNIQNLSKNVNKKGKKIGKYDFNIIAYLILKMVEWKGN